MRNNKIHIEPEPYEHYAMLIQSFGDTMADARIHNKWKAAKEFEEMKAQATRDFRKALIRNK